MFEKLFKVAQIVGHNLGYQQYQYILVAEDGQAWQVARTRNNDSLDWEVGQTIAVPVGDDILLWGEVGGDGAMPHHLRNPKESVAKVWGKQVEEVEPPRWDRAFESDDFSTTPLDAAFTKAQVANEFMAFVKSSFAEECLTNLLSHKLAKMFSLVEWHTGHKLEQLDYTNFKTAKGRLDFIKHIAEYHPSGEPTHSWVDVERSLKAWVIQKVLPKMMKTANTAKSISERQQLRKLLEKHGLPDDFKLPDQK